MSENLIQGTREWKMARYGNISASRIADMLATTKTGESASRANYRAQLVAERMTGTSEDSFTSPAMAWGTETEPLARASYEIAFDAIVEEVGYIIHPHIPKSGASPDGLIDRNGLLEIKCPNTATHIKYLLSDKPPAQYVPQMAWQLACTKREWCDFASFDPRMDKPDQLFCVRYVPESGYIDFLEEEVRKFNLEIENMIAEIIKKRSRY
jgi:putative phage-type endonuclease